MDVYCTNCGEPWDVNEPADVGGAKTPAQLAAKGSCPYCEGDPAKGSCPYCEGDPAKAQRPTSDKPTRAELSGALAELLGDDLDGLASELEDAEFLLGGLD